MDMLLDDSKLVPYSTEYTRGRVVRRTVSLFLTLLSTHMCLLE